MIASIFECGGAIALASDTTAVDGSYAFGPDELGTGNICLDPGKTYTVTFSFPADGSLDNLNYSTGDPAGVGACDGTDSSDDSASDDGTTGCVDPSADTDDEHIDIGLFACEEVSGVAFLDANNDGCQEQATDLGVAGMIASIFECGGAAALTSDTTAVDGSYAFGPTETGGGNICLDPGKTYTVTFSFPTDGSLDNLNYSTGDPIGVCDGTDSSDDSAANDGTTACFDPSDPASGDDGDEDIDIGLYPCETIGGVVFIDSDEDGCQADPTDGVAGLTVDLYVCDANGMFTQLGTTMTAVDGSYVFGIDECLDPALEYRTQISAPAGYSFTSGTADACLGDEDDSPANDGISGCYNPSDTDAVDTNTDEHIDFGIVCDGVKTDAIALGSVTPCTPAGQPIDVNITTDDTELLPAGYQILYILTDPSGNIVTTNPQSFYTVSGPGSYTGYSVAYNPADYDVATAISLTEITTNMSCGDVSVALPIEIRECCTAFAGLTINETVSGCAGGDHMATLSWTTSLSNLPPGYIIEYILADGANGLIFDISSTPMFTVSQPDYYAVHQIVYHPAEFDITSYVINTDYVYEINADLFNSDLCADLDLVGGHFLVQDCCTQDLYIPGVGISVPGAHYERDGIISSDGLIDSSPTDFDSGTAIEMLPGFEVILGVEFHAYIDGCN